MELFLTATEKAMFEALPAELKEGWTVTEETQTTYETLDQIQMRYYMTDLAQYPELKGVADALAKGEEVKELSLDDVSEDFQSEFLFAIGARGVNGLMQTLLQELKTDDDLAALASLSMMRHHLLMINASSPEPVA